MKKNLVMGAGSNYGWYIFEPFIRSFVKNVPSADLVLFVDNNSDFTLHKMKAVVGDRLKFEPFPESLRSGRPNNIRWKLFLDYVEKYGENYEQILTTDVRDVIFQADIFENFSDQKSYLGYTLEADNIRGEKGGSDLNYKWITELYGKEEADFLGDKNILCDGTVIGTVHEMKIFLKKMWENMPREKFHDQTVQQYLIYHNLLPIENLIPIDCWTGAIFTSYVYHEWNPIEVKDNLILRGDGKVPAVVHQYDRQDFLTKIVDKIYRSSDGQPDENFIDTKSLIDRMPHLIKNEKFSTVAEFFSKYLSNDAELTKYFKEIIGCWELLSEKRRSDPSADALGVIFQHKIIAISNDNFYLNHGKSICNALKQCRKNQYTLIEGFEDWTKQKIVKAVKWHLEHNNAPRYATCVFLMNEMELTDCECFYFLNAEWYRSLGEKDMSFLYYQKALQSQKMDSDEKKRLICEYHKKLIDEMKFFKNPRAQFIIPTSGENEKNLIFDVGTNSFIKTT
ncbi:MAG: hypothetical protein IJU55_01725 [Selenomonadaceae bacterium]|nr:hypothetical protein [Selenomonadaceae bacterium]